MARSRTIFALFMSFQVTLTAFGADSPAPNDIPPASSAPAAKSHGPLFQLAALQQAAPLLQKLRAARTAQNLEEAEKICRAFIETVPFSPEGPYNLACVLARKNRIEEAFTALDTAIRQGFRNLEQLRTDPDLAALRDQPAFQALIERAGQPPAAQAAFQPQASKIIDGIARVEDANTVLEARSGLFISLFQPHEPAPRHQPVTTLTHAAGKQVNAWWLEGSAAGHSGDLYDNRDGDHSDLRAVLFPQLARIEYGEEARTLQLHWGLPQRLIHSGVILGNASVALTGGPFWRSMPRMAVTDARHLTLLQIQFAQNQLYVYPAHQDFRETTDSRRVEDALVANTPYLITTFGSSGSDQVFLQALALTMAAFQPEVKTKIIAEKILAPTLQMIFRQSNRPVQNPEDYFSGKAHPPVFRGEDLDPEKMVQTAHAMTADTLTPLIHLRVIEEDRPVAGRDFFDITTNENIFDTPWAIARVFRGTPRIRRMVLDASASRDIGGKPLQFRWAVLCGDTENIKIKPLNPENSRVEILMPWHTPRPIDAHPEFRTTRADIGCFAGNGTHWSAPGLVSFYFPGNEDRLYDNDGRIRQVTYTDRYVDPMLVTPRQWKDEYHYDGNGRMTGWSRHRSKTIENFTAEGLLIVEKDSDGRPTATRPVRYLRRQASRGQAPILEQAIQEPAP